MRLLLDSHVLIWAVENPTRLGAQAVPLIRDPVNDRYVSAATIWEIGIKVGNGKLTLSLPFRDWISKGLNDLIATILPITVDHADELTRLPSHHRDPFDRMLLAQAIVEQLTLVSADATLDQYGVTRVW